MSKLVEEWKDIEGYEGLYQVSDWGRVKSLERFIETSTGLRRYKEKIIAQNLKKDGYYEVSLYYKGEREHRRVNRLVAEAFILNPENKPVVGHIKKLPDGTEDRTANEAWNLQWMTYPENNNYGTANERKRNHPSKSSQVFQYTLDGKLIAVWPSTMEIEREMGFDNTNIGRCCRGKTKTSNGHKWSYVPL